MKKILAFILALTFAAGIVPAAASAEKTSGGEEISAVLFKADFEGCDVTDYKTPDDAFATWKGNVPQGIDALIGDGDSGSIIVDKCIDGSKSLKLIRFNGGTGVIRTNEINTNAYADGTKLIYSFTFRYGVLGNYGFTSILSGTDHSMNLDDYGGETRNIFAAKTYTETGKDSIFLVNADPSQPRQLVYDGLTANTDYRVEFIFTMGSDQYDMFLNGQKIGTYKYIDKMTGITGFRIDNHDWEAECDYSRSQPGDIHVNDIYVDNIFVGIVGEPKMAEGGSDTKEYKFDPYDDLFLDDFEFLEACEEFTQPKPDEENPMYTYLSELPFLTSEKGPFFNPNGFARAVEGDGNIGEDDISLELKDFADIRFWNQNIVCEEGDFVRASVLVKVDTLTGGYIDMCVSNSDDPDRITNTETTGGRVWKIRPSLTEKGKLDLVNSWDMKIATLETGTVYKIGTVFEPDSRIYRFFVNDEYIVGSTSKYPLDFTGIEGMRFNLSNAAGSLFTIDEVRAESGFLSERTDNPGDVPSTAVPEATEQPVATPTEQPTQAPTQQPTEKPAEATPAAESTDAPEATENAENKNSDESSGSNTGLIIGIIAGVAVVAAVIVIILKKKK